MNKESDLSSYYEIKLMIRKIYKKQLVIKDGILSNDDKIIIIGKTDKILNDIVVIFGDINLVDTSISKKINTLSEEFNLLKEEVLNMKLNRMENILPTNNKLKFLQSLLSSSNNKKKIKNK